MTEPDMTIDHTRKKFEDWYTTANNIDHPGLPLHRWNLDDPMSEYRNRFVRAYWAGFRASASRTIELTDNEISSLFGLICGSELTRETVIEFGRDLLSAALNGGKSDG